MIIVTSCTARKRQYSQFVKLDPIENEPLSDYLPRWLNACDEIEVRVRAENLYTGRGFQLVHEQSLQLGAPLYIVSAGLGLLAAADRIPPYDQSIMDLAASASKMPGTSTGCWWWHAINKQRLSTSIPLCRLIKENPSQVFLLALPKFYIELVNEDLESVPDEHLEQLRIFTSSQGRNVLPASVRRVCLPYDDRLNAIPSAHQGTQMDFAQRALVHFCQIKPSDLVNDYMWVNEQMSNAPARMVKTLSAEGREVQSASRVRTSDEQIKLAIQEHWDKGTGTSIGLLKVFRTELGISCSVERFDKLFKAVKQEMNGGSHG